MTVQRQEVTNAFQVLAECISALPKSPLREAAATHTFNAAILLSDAIGMSFPNYRASLAGVVCGLYIPPTQAKSIMGSFEASAHAAFAVMESHYPAHKATLFYADSAQQLARQDFEHEIRLARGYYGSAEHRRRNGHAPDSPPPA